MGFSESSFLPDWGSPLTTFDRTIYRVRSLKNHCIAGIPRAAQLHNAFES
jgi:hypothetical protein